MLTLFTQLEVKKSWFKFKCNVAVLYTLLSLASKCDLSLLLEHQVKVQVIDSLDDSTVFRYDYVG